MGKHLINLVGKKYGKLEVMDFWGLEEGHYYWNCRCECGNFRKTDGGSLRSGVTKSCGCLNKFTNLVGGEFGKLKVESFSHKEGGNYYWSCRCECGTLRIVDGSSLKSGRTRSCGCLKKELMKSSRTTHGQYKDGKTTTEINRWMGMKSRCYNLNSPHYKDYGGRGIKVCDRWLESFDNFFEDLGKCPEGMTLDRINNDGDYEPGNVKWSTRKEQANNRRNNRPIIFNGETKNLLEWATYLGISYNILWGRLRRWDNDVERALTTPVKGN